MNQQHTQNVQALSATMAIFDEYERRFDQKRLLHPAREAWKPEDRAEILAAVKQALSFDDSLIPNIHILDTQDVLIDGVRAQHLLFESWEHFYGVATLFLPDDSAPRPAPLVLVCPGHGADGRLSGNYQRMARRLSKQGAYALVVENIGQGGRTTLGHADVPEVFYCGLTVQGLIVAETRGWIRYMKQQPNIDASRIGACGNSGGGTLTQFLCALESDLAAVASCGYPSEYAYIFQKERRHCDCNLLRGVIGNLEMWEVYSLFAPKPLLLNCGRNDALIPVEYFSRNARKVAFVYEMMGQRQKFRQSITETLHPWDSTDIDIIAAFFADTFALDKAGATISAELISPDSVKLSLPADAMTTAQLAQRLSGIQAPKNLSLVDVFPPTYQGAPIKAADIVTNVGRGDVMRVFSQFEISLM